MIPVLHEDGSSLDWKTASYSVEIEVDNSSALVTHELREAHELLKLIEDGDAAYAVEARCPRTLFARTWVTSPQTGLANHSPDPKPPPGPAPHADASATVDNVVPRPESGPVEQKVTWCDADVDGQVFLFPGVLALKETSLPTTGLIDLWEEDAVRVRSGAWLARGAAFCTRNLAASLIEFRRDDSLEKGRMRVDEYTGGDDARFLIRLAPEIYRRAAQGDRDVQVAGLIAAFAKLPVSPRFDEHSDSPVARMLRDRLEAAEIPAWDGDDDWDPAWAATVIEGFYPASFSEADP